MNEPLTGFENYETIDSLVKKYPHLFAVNTLRWQLRDRATNGLDKHVTRFGRKLYIFMPGFLEWFREQR